MGEDDPKVGCILENKIEEFSVFLDTPPARVALPESVLRINYDASPPHHPVSLP